MPVQYSSILDEHSAVRNSVGLFDVSHMGEIEIRGPEAVDVVEYVSTNSASRLKIGQVHYSALLYGHGGFVDDILVHKVAEDHFFLCVNASNQEKDFEHIQKHNRFHADVEFASDRYAQIAIQGPNALATLQRRRRRFWNRSSITGLSIARSAECPHGSRARAIPVKTGLKSTSHLPKRHESGRNCSKPGRNSGSGPAVWVPATHYAWRRRWPSMDMS